MEYDYPDSDDYDPRFYHIPGWTNMDDDCPSGYESWDELYAIRREYAPDYDE